MEPKIEIEFEDTSRTFKPGEEIEGRVILISNETDCHISEIIISLIGKRVAITNPERPEETYMCEDQIILLDHDEILQSDQMLEFPFKFHLPSELPTSFRASRAFIEYHLNVAVKIKSEFDVNYKTPFYINGILRLEENLNDENQTIEIRHSKAVGCFSCFNWRNSHRFGFTAKLLKSQYLPGENIDFVVDIWNSSKSTLGDLKISLIRELRMLDSGNYRTILKEYGVISEVLGPVSVAPGGKLMWSSSNTEDDGKPVLNIPDDTPPTHLGCKKFVDLNYFVKISMTSRAFCSSTLFGKIPIIIGSSLA